MYSDSVYRVKISLLQSGCRICCYKTQHTDLQSVDSCIGQIRPQCIVSFSLGLCDPQNEGESNVNSPRSPSLKSIDNAVHKLSVEGHVPEDVELLAHNGC